jgi:S-adenosylmethionine-diacylglycerol 3-amino-3-carboxypropyl transferase
VRENLRRLTLFEGGIEPMAEAEAFTRGQGFDGYNLSDIFEYMDEATSAQAYGRLLATARPGARFAYWNMLAPRRLAPSFPDRVRALDDEAAALFARDLAFFYSAFVIDQVTGEVTA